MATRIRLQRHGKKGKPFFHIVVADQRSKRDGRFIEKIGTYNPNSNPATIDIDFEKSLSWIQNGAQPSDTARAILSYKGVLMKDHLLRGVAKGALTAEQAEAKFAKWEDEKFSKIDAKRSTLSQSKEAERKARLAAEVEVNAARVAAQAALLASETAEEIVEAAEETVEQATEQVVETAESAAEVVEQAADVVAETVVEAASDVVEQVAEVVEPTNEESAPAAEGSAPTAESAEEETKKDA